LPICSTLDVIRHSERLTSRRCSSTEISMRRALHCTGHLALAALNVTAAATGVSAHGAPGLPRAERAAEHAPVGTPPELRGTSWRWVGFTSPAEALTIAEPERYTLAFVEGDRVALRADCNRGSAPVSSSSPGVLGVGPMAMTRAMCPPGSLSGRFAHDVSRAVRYSIRGGELHLGLPTDSGVLRFVQGP
jgi:heat shock protein HslJ